MKIIVQMMKEALDKVGPEVESRALPIPQFSILHGYVQRLKCAPEHT